MERRVSVNGIELAYEEEGAGARPLVLVHGWSGSRQDFAPVLSELAREHGRVLALDLRGHGASTHTGDAQSYTLAQLADDLGSALAALGIARCDLLGHSMGGMLAQRLALARPERIASLLLVSTSAEPLAWVEPAQLELAERVGREAGMAQLAALLRARAAQDAARGVADRRLEEQWGAERFWAWREGRIRQMDPAAIASLGRAMREAPSLLGDLGRIACPALVLVGAFDAEFLEPSARLAAGLPDARYAVIPEAGHQPQLEAPAAFLLELRRHLARARPS